MGFSNILDVAIGLVFIYVVLSLLATTVSEVIEGQLKSRGRYCLKALQEMFGAVLADKMADPQDQTKQLSNRQMDSAGKAVLPAALKPAPAQGAAAAPQSPKSAATLLYAFFDHPFVYALYRGNNPVPVSADGQSLVRKARNYITMVFDLLSGEKTDDLKFLRGQKASLPSYIPASTFAQTIVVMLRELVKGNATATIDDMVSGVEANWPNGKFRDAVVACLRQAQADTKAAEADIQKVQALLEDWYNAVMDRATGWYKRHKQGILFWCGLAACAVFNVNSVHIAQTLYNDATLRAVVVSEAESAAKSDIGKLKTGCASDNGAGAKSDTKTDVKPVPKDGQKPQDKPTPGDGATADSASAQSGDDSGVAKDVANIQCYNAKLVDMKLPIGWTREGVEPRVANILLPVWDKIKAVPGRISDFFTNKKTAAEPNTVKPSIHPSKTKAGIAFISMFAGWLITAYAITLGAPFWFDLLNQLVNIRATFKPEEVKAAAGQSSKKVAAAPR
ncbi:hypothetical protein [Asticcacaulis solisilvae]|uniref:hypothetical protein n=1 Tax=Asticcacaulis solisilvae TaxID=1217274 RepID=UPI003FD8BEB1